MPPTWLKLGFFCPPGITFLASKLPYLAANYACVSFIIHASRKLLGIELRFTTLVELLIVFSLMFVVTVINMVIAQARKQKEADALGAVLPPTVDGFWPGNVDILLEALKGDRDGYIGDCLQRWSGQFEWTFNARIFWQDKVITAEPEHIKMILATHFDNFEKGPIFKKHMKSVLGDGIFNADGEMWRLHRSMTRPFFSKDRISHFELFGKHADEAIKLLRERTHAGFAVDIQDLVSRFTLDSATEFLFGHCVHVIKAGLPYPPNIVNGAAFKLPAEKQEDAASRFSEAFANAQMNGSLRSRFGSLWPLFELWKDKTKDDMKTIEAFVDPIIRDAAEKRKLHLSGSVKNHTDDGDTLLDHLLEYSDDTEFLRFEILNIMIAGRDTTAATLAFAMYCLAMHPEHLKCLRDEILHFVGSSRNPTSDDLKEMKYLRAVINETMRLYPPVPLNSRSNINPIILPNRAGEKPWYLPAGTRVIYSVFSMHRRTDLWGPDAAIFDPNRFLDARAWKYLTPNPFIFLPFNAGPRICLGQQFAYNEASFMLVKLLQAFDSVVLAPDAQPAGSHPPAEWAREAVPRRDRKAIEKVWVKSHLTIYAEDGLWVKLREAPSSEAD